MTYNVFSGTLNPTHFVALVRISDAGLKRAARDSLKIQHAKIAKNSPAGHHHTTLSGCIFATEARIDNRENLLNSNIPPHVFTIWRTSAY